MKDFFSKYPAVVVLVILAMVVWGFIAKKDDARSGLAAASAQEEYWRERISMAGGAAAYREFSTAVAELSVGEQHTLSHTFGGALWEVEGVSGLSVCDNQFSYGCSHEFLGRAIAELGLDAVPNLNEMCFKALQSKSLSCQHGIGHGIQAFLGYTLENLQKGLAICRGLPHSDAIGGCYGGMFMEYNVRTMLAEQAVPRKYTGNPAEPCDVLEEPYRLACFFWQPQWWFQEILHAEATPESFKRLGELCFSSAPNAGARRSCFEGIGNITSMAADFIPEKATTLCNATSEEGLERLFCLSLTANSIGIDINIEAGKRVCDGLSADALTFCLAYAENKANILRVISPPETL